MLAGHCGLQSWSSLPATLRTSPSAPKEVLNAVARQAVALVVVVVTPVISQPVIVLLHDVLHPRVDVPVLHMTLQSLAVIIAVHELPVVVALTDDGIEGEAVEMVELVLSVLEA